MQELFRSFPAILDEFEQNDEVRESLVFAAWRRSAGELLCERSAPLEYREKRLAVAVADETWRRHLVDLCGRMIFKLNADLGTGVVEFIEFRIDAKAVARARGSGDKKQKPGPDSLDAVAPDLMDSAANIQPENLRIQFLLTANELLSRDKRRSV